MTWKEEISNALRHLGGEAKLSEIYEFIQENTTRQLSDSWTATVRNIIEHSSSDSASYDGGEDLYYSAMGVGLGIWGLRDFEPTAETVEITQDDSGFAEGRKKLRIHIIRERNPRVITLAKKKALAETGTLCCAVCGFNFEERYGEIGKGFIEGHHIKPVSQLLPDEETKVDDIILLCSNCHSMVHRKRPWLTKEQLKSLLPENAL